MIRRRAFHERHLLHPQVIADEHKRILAMMKAGDAERAAAEMDDHLTRARKKLVAHLKQAGAGGQAR